MKTVIEIDLDGECALISRYLIGREPAQELKDRYRAAHRILLGDNAAESDQPEMRFLRRHPWALPYLDAGAAILHKESILRKKTILMAAILEATLIHADFFLKPPDPVFKLLCSLFWQGVRAVAKTAVGIPIFLVARRST
jgi:hypothetical protein